MVELPGCPLCGSHDVRLHAVATDVEYFTSPDAFSFHRCDPCGVLFISPMPHDRLGEIYPPNYYAFARSGGGLVSRIKEALDRRLSR